MGYPDNAGGQTERCRCQSSQSALGKLGRNRKGRIAAALSHQLISKKAMNVASLMMIATSTLSSRFNRRTM